MTQKKKVNTGNKFLAFLRSKAFVSGVTLLLGFVIVFGVFTVVATPKRHSLKVGDIADTTITATKDIEDTIATQKLRDAAAASVVDGTTKMDTSISAAVDENVLSILTTLMEAIIKAKPAAAKGTYIKSMVVSSTMGPGVKFNSLKF